MNAPAKISPAEVFVGQVIPPERRADVFKALPAHISPARFERNLQTAIAHKPELLKQDPRLIMREVSKAVSLGLYLDPFLGEAYLVEVWNGKAKRNDVQLRVGYKGLMSLARRSGEVEAIYSNEICENDIVRINLGVPKVYDHTINPLTERGPARAFAAVVAYKSGGFDFEVMSQAEVEKIRERSDAWRAFKAGKIKSTPWSTDPGAMSLKTVLRRLLKRQQLSPDLADALRHEDQADDEEAAGGMVDVTPQKRGRGRPPLSPEERTAKSLRVIAGADTPNPDPDPDPDGDEDEGENAEGVQVDEDGVVLDDQPAGDDFPGDRPLEAQAEVEPIDTKSADYIRGLADRQTGRTKCLNAEIRDTPVRMRHWQAGFDSVGATAQ